MNSVKNRHTMQEETHPTPDDQRYFTTRQDQIEDDDDPVVYHRLASEYNPNEPELDWHILTSAEKEARCALRNRQRMAQYRVFKERATSGHTTNPHAFCGEMETD